MEAQEKMNTQFQRIMSSLLANAERDVRFAAADGDKPALAKANA